MNIVPCRSCRAPMVFVATKRKDGSFGLMPVNFESTGLTIEELAELDRLEFDGGEKKGGRHMSHYATCPDAARYRRKAPA